MPPARTTQWFINPKHPVLLSDWQDHSEAGTVAYYTATGDTHLITPEGALILEILQEQSFKLSAEEITEEFRSRLNKPDLEFDADDIRNSFLVPFLDLELIDYETVEVVN